ncbi:MAG: DNA polymerase I [Burkholderiales bacterium]
MTSNEIPPPPPATQPYSGHKLLLVDGSSYLYRAFHALPDLRSSEGFPTGAIHGMVAMMKRLREQVQANHAACVFDAKGPTFRDEWYSDYKAHRSPMPEALVQQIEPIHEVVKLLGWPVLMVPGIEADDAIGTLARVAAQMGHHVVISTGDKDLAQLVNPQVTLINTMSNEMLDEAGVSARFGVAPEKIVDYLTLVGDAVDNVPGVDKVGPKTAAKWIREYGSLEGVIAASGHMKGVAGDNLRKALDWLPQARRLVTVKTDCDLAGYLKGWPMISALAFQEPDQTALLAFYTRFNFKTWARELEAQAGQTASLFAPREPTQAPRARSLTEASTDFPAPLTERHDDTILTPQALQHWLQKIRAAPLCALNTKTDSLDAMQARLIGISLSVKPGEGAYIPLRHDYPGAPEQLTLDHVLGNLRPWLEDPLAAKVGQNIKFDLHVFENAGIRVQGYVHDTLLQSYVLEAHKPHGLQSLADRHLGRKGVSYEDLCGKGAHQISFSQVDIPRAAHYASENSDMTLHVHEVLMPCLQAEPRLQRIYSEMEIPLAHVLQHMERSGVLIDPALLALQSRDLGERLHILEQEAHALAGQAFNLGSPKQIGDILFHQQKLPIIKKTATGAPSTDEEVLEKLALDYPLPAKLLAYRSLAKLKSTYTDKLPHMIHPHTGRVHTTYEQAVAVTGRLSSNEPNLQNIPVRTPEGRRIRTAFIAPPGHQLLSADYSQIELRIMAHLSEDRNLLAAFAQGQDVHRATAAEIFGVTPQDVTSEQRRYAKVINFGLIYGMSAFGLASNLGIERHAASHYIDRYFSRYPGVKNYMDSTRAQAKAQGYVETIFGRRLWLPEINSPNGPRRSAAERAAINAPMQGTAADLIKLAMIKIQQEIDTHQLQSRMVMQVHDELVLEVPNQELEWGRHHIPRIMAGVAELKIPLIAEIGEGHHWEEAH